MKKHIELDKKIVKALKKNREQFRKTFGRDPRPEDPVFWDDRYTDYPRPMTEEYLRESMEKAIRKACENLGFSEEKTKAAISSFLDR